jgi:DNA-binding response OmpR family regulator
VTALLVVEDDPRVASFLCRGLEAEGYRVVHVTEGEAALDAADDASFAAILLDVMLAGALDGRAVCQALRRRRDTTPILMLTALDTVQDRIEGLRMGADDYLGKPFSFDELLLRVAALIRRAGGAQPVSRLELGDLVLDRETLIVTRGNQRVDLTSRELALVELLMSAPERVFSRERILSNVWGVSEDPMTNVVDVYVGRLRRKLGLEGPAGPVITTVRGRGYRIEFLAEEAAAPAQPPGNPPR